MNQQRWMSQNFFLFFMTWGIFLPYWTGWLIDAKGLTVAEASLIMSFSLVARGVSTLFAFPVVSKYYSNKRVITLLMIAGLITALLYLPVSSFTALFAVTFLFSFFFLVFFPALYRTAGVFI